MSSNVPNKAKLTGDDSKREECNDYIELLNFAYKNVI